MPVLFGASLASALLVAGYGARTSVARSQPGGSPGRCGARRRASRHSSARPGVARWRPRLGGPHRRPTEPSATGSGTPAGSSVPRKDEITTAARSLLEEEGPEALTMRRLASRLGIQAPSLYKHIGGKGELEAALAALALEEIADRPRGCRQPRGARARLSRFALAHPHLYRFANERPLPRDRLPEGLEARAAAPVVRAAGGDPDRARAVWAFAHGMVGSSRRTLPAGCRPGRRLAGRVRAFAAGAPPPRTVVRSWTGPD